MKTILVTGTGIGHRASGIGHRARSLDKFGVKLMADGVAEVVWDAAHGDGLHYMTRTSRS